MTRGRREATEIHQKHHASTPASHELRAASSAASGSGQQQIQRPITDVETVLLWQRPLTKERTGIVRKQ